MSGMTLRQLWAETRLGNAEPVAPRQARPDDDIVVLVVRDVGAKVRYFRFGFGPEGPAPAIEKARRFAFDKLNEGCEFVAGHVGYLAESREDYTRTADWTLEGDTALSG